MNGSPLFDGGPSSVEREPNCDPVVLFRETQLAAALLTFSLDGWASSALAQGSGLMATKLSLVRKSAGTYCWVGGSYHDRAVARRGGG